MSETPLQPCPYVECESSDAFSFNSNGYGKCHSCGNPYPSNKKMFDWAKEKYPVTEKKPKVKWRPKETPYFKYDGIRGLDEDVARLFGIQRQLDEDGEWLQDAFRYPNNIKYRSPDKEFSVKHSGVQSLDLFGPEFNAGSSKHLYLTEGEYDAPSLYQILGKSHPVKSLPSAGVGDKFIKHNHEYLNSFERIIYAGELDKAGKEAAERLYKAYPDKMWFVPMSKHKDANDFLTAGDGEELMWAARKPQRFSPDNFFCSDTEFENILREENPYEATPTGHAALDYMTRGLVRGGITFIKAPPGTGKTEIVRYLERSMLNTDAVKIALIHMEEMKSTTLRCMATYELETNVRTKEDALEAGISEDAVVKAALDAAKGERTIIFEMRIEDDPTKIIDYVQLAAGVYGADYIFIDHIQRLTYLSGTDNAVSNLTKVAANLAQLCKELNIGVIVISHVNEDGDTKYAKSLQEEAIILLRINRDKDSDDPILANTTTMEVEKNRPFSRLGDAGKLFWDPETTLLEEI